jgi:Sigma-70 region 2
VRYDEAPDAELIAAIPSSAAAFDSFYRRHISAVMRFLARRCDTPEDVADAAADTFLAVLGSWSTYRPERGSVAAWLYGIAGVLRHLQEAVSARRTPAPASFAHRSGSLGCTVPGNRFTYTSTAAGSGKG